MLWMWEIAICKKKKMLLTVAEFKYSLFFEGSSLVTSHKICNNVMGVTLPLKNQDWKRSLMSPSTKFTTNVFY